MCTLILYVECYTLLNLVAYNTFFISEQINSAEVATTLFTEITFIHTWPWVYQKKKMLCKHLVLAKKKASASQDHLHAGRIQIHKFSPFQQQQQYTVNALEEWGECNDTLQPRKPEHQLKIARKYTHWRSRLLDIYV